MSGRPISRSASGCRPISTRKNPSTSPPSTRSSAAAGRRREGSRGGAERRCGGASRQRKGLYLMASQGEALRPTDTAGADPYHDEIATLIADYVAGVSDALDQATEHAAKRALIDS